jgi:hypothetical protein
MSLHWLPVQYRLQYKLLLISYVLFWFNLNLIELIHTLTSDKQVSRRLNIFCQLSSGFITRYISVHLSVIGINLMTKIMASANFTMLHLLKTSACFSTGHYTCKNKQVQLQSHATFKFATSNVIDRTPPKMRAKH